MPTALAVSAFGVVGSAPNTVVTALIAGGGAAALTFVGQLMFRRQQRDSLIASASDQVVSAATGLLDGYRQELRDAQEEISKLRERISALEAELATAKKDVRRIERERQLALDRLTRTQEHVVELERKMLVLERVTSKRKTDRKDTS